MERMGTSTTVTSESAITEEFIAEHRMWIAVLAKAVEDWRFGSLRARREAQEFLFESDDDFHLVCAGAGVDPAKVRSMLLKIGTRLAPQVRFVHPLAA